MLTLLPLLSQSRTLAICGNIRTKRFTDGTDLNLFHGYGIPPEKAGACDIRPLLDHILNIWCGGCQTAFEYTLDWIANVVGEISAPSKDILQLATAKLASAPNRLHCVAAGRQLPPWRGVGQQRVGHIVVGRATATR